MNEIQKGHTAIQYRKRPEPHRVVSVASQRRTGSGVERANGGPLVSHCGNLLESESWYASKTTGRVEISPSSWRGLHNRMISSPMAKAEVS